MSKLIQFSPILEQKEPSEKQIIKSVLSDIPYKPNSGKGRLSKLSNVKNQQAPAANSGGETGSFALGYLPYQLNPKTPDEAMRTLVIIGLKLIVNHITGVLVDMKLNEYTINTIKKHKKNEKLFAFIKKEADAVYRANEGYKPCSAKQFERSSIWEFMLSEWRHGSAKDKAHYVARHSFDNLITVFLEDIIPIPGGSIVIGPIVKGALQYIGADIMLRPLYNLVVEIEGETLSFGLTYKPNGFAFTDIILYTFNKEGKLVANHLPNPPQSLYRLTTQDAREILNKMGWDASLDKLKGMVKGNGK